MRDTIVIFPVYNAEKNIASIIQDFKVTKPNGQYIIIDDGSTDSTAQICKEKDYNIISLSSHKGLETAIETGYKFALEHNYKYVVCVDGSGFYSSKDIDKLLACFNDKFDIIIGARHLKWNDLSLGQKIHSNIIWKQNKKKIFDPTSGLNAISVRILRNLISTNNKKLNTSFISNQISQGFTIKEVLVSYSINSKNKYFKNETILSALAHNFAHNFFKSHKKGGIKRW